MSRIARLVVVHRRAVILIWAALLVATAAIGSRAFSVLSTDFGAGRATESGRVAQRLDDLKQTGGQLAIVVDGIDLTDPDVERTVTAGIAPIAALDGVLAVADPWTTPIEALRASDGRAALAIVTLAGGLEHETESAVADQVVALAHQLDAPQVLVGGNVLVSETFATASETDLLRGEAIALPIAIVVMVLLLGGLVAAGMPLLVAVGGVLTTLAVLVGAAQLGDVSIFSVNVVNMLGIGLGIDYGLLVVNRFREERGRGLDVNQAVAATVATAGTTVVFSALTVAVAMSGLFVFGVPLLTSFGIAGLAVVLASMAAAVTLLPATLSLVGHRIRPVAAEGALTVSDRAGSTAGAGCIDGADGRFYRLARRVQRRPVAVAGAVALVLVALGVPFLGARFENGDARALPRSSEVRAAALTMAQRFPTGGTDPVTVVVDADPADPALRAWFESMSTAPGVVGASIRGDVATGGPTDSPADSPVGQGGPTVIDLVPAGTSQGSTATALVQRVRLQPPPFPTEVGGPAAELLDVKDTLGSRLPLAGAVVGLGTLVLLFLMTGSVVVPAKAVVMNVLSLGASFGALAFIFQDGHLAGLLRFDPVGALDLWMPVLILIFAFGLSMDYEVFLLSRIKEVYDHTGDNDLAVAVGLQRSGRIITSAAALIVIVFAGFAAGEVLAIKQLGVGLAIAVVIDATLVRTLLVPATMKLLGARNWWAPAPLRRFHDRYGLHEASEFPTPLAAEPVVTAQPVVLTMGRER